MWNSFPAETTDFSGLDKFNNSVSNMFLLKFCQVKGHIFKATVVKVGVIVGTWEALPDAKFCKN